MKHIAKKKIASKRGRPKGSKNKPKAKSIRNNTPAKKRGRPKGSKNKNKKPVVFKIAKKRGRPKGSHNKPQLPHYQDKCRSLGKFLGYCKCGLIIAQKDMNTMRTVCCKGCGKVSKISSLKQEKKVADNDNDVSSTKYHEPKHHNHEIPDETPDVNINDDNDIIDVDLSGIKVRDI